MPHATVYGSVICLHRESRACCMRPRDRLGHANAPPEGSRLRCGSASPPPLGTAAARRALGRTSASFTVLSTARSQRLLHSAQRGACVRRGSARRREPRGLGARSTKSSRARAFWQAHRAPPAARPRRSCSSSGAAHRARGSPPRCRTDSSNWAPTKQSQGSGR
jgi:hypothetical protein